MLAISATTAKLKNPTSSPTGFGAGNAAAAGRALTTATPAAPSALAAPRRRNRALSTFSTRTSFTKYLGRAYAFLPAYRLRSEALPSGRMPRRPLTLLAIAGCCAVAAGCGDGGTVGGAAPPPTSAVTPALAKRPKQDGEIIVRGDASPGSHGPYRLSGTYTARFEQYAPEDPKLDFAAQTPFTARLDPHVASDSDTRK